MRHGLLSFLWWKHLQMAGRNNTSGKEKYLELPFAKDTHEPTRLCEIALFVCVRCNRVVPFYVLQSALLAPTFLLHKNLTFPLVSRHEVHVCWIFQEPC